ncbi:glycoside hydrolase family 47 protein [Xylariaceae sp. FL1019]|nr:glycoside hydrolase family 47 protein [Xylariaceae sp. FL1019]
MLRLRRYRYYVFFAAILVFLLFRVARNSEQWESVSASFGPIRAPRKSLSKTGSSAGNDEPYNGMGSEDAGLPQQILDNTRNQYPTHGPGETLVNPDVADEEPEKSARPATIEEDQVLAYDQDGATKVTVPPVIDIPDKSVGKGAKTTNVHWEKPIENFPVPESEIIALPTGKPNKIPTIQYPFKKESAEAKEKRELRQDKVRNEMERAWAGYMTYAKGHDELSPVTKKFRDPFCGWAATLVDSLDTLWIMGMVEEFEDALLEVEKIDFTTSTRTEIPVFETTIRYLGGLIAAYDVSGGKKGKYDILLDKAIELAEILMGVFDTPNRMPILYYNWKPPYSSQPKRATTGGSVAELGSLAMEFTRLAQITKEDKYYDAVARITDAFYEWQQRGTSISGIFPERVDLSGCNQTAQNELEAARSAQSKDEADDASDDTELDSGKDEKKASLYKRGGNELKLNRQKNPATGQMDVIVEKSSHALPECVSQGLTSGGWGSEQYSMGGSQDSTYEYFPKQWLLLGGLEPKYKELHLETIKAVKKWLLFKPMVPDDRDILFSGKVTTRGEPEADANTDYEVTHLTCFIGGMFGMGGRIFDIPADVEMAERLTDGCVWAYESTATGIMPEYAHVATCADPENCSWNQTAYYQQLDPQYNSRDTQIKNYYKRKAKVAAEKLEKEAAERVKAAELAATKDKIAELKKTNLEYSDSLTEKAKDLDDEYTSLQKRAPTSFAKDDDEDDEDSVPASGFKVTVTGTQTPLVPSEDSEEWKDPSRPFTHEEFVANKIERENLPPGFVGVNSKSYILRPEAIESVWYMYRITGDKKWQDKGWKMFQSIVKYTATEVGSSAIGNVLDTETTQNNEMESFWTAETLKYFYLLYSDPDSISLDDWVLNTEAHPFKRPTAAFGK